MALDMFPTLFGATHEYWRKLDSLELRYHHGELSLEEVNVQAKLLMKDLGDERRRSLVLMKQLTQNWLVTQKDSLIAVSAIALLVYGWCLTVNVA